MDNTTKAFKLFDGDLASVPSDGVLTYDAKWAAYDYELVGEAFEISRELDRQVEFTVRKGAVTVHVTVRPCSYALGLMGEVRAALNGEFGTDVSVGPAMRELLARRIVMGNPSNPKSYVL